MVKGSKRARRGERHDDGVEVVVGQKGMESIGHDSILTGLGVSVNRIRWEDRKKLTQIPNPVKMYIG